MTRTHHVLALAVLALSALALCAAPTLAQRNRPPANDGPSLRVPADMKRYETKYYVMFTDITEDEAREAAIRMTKMAEEYHARTQDFSGAIRQKFPFYLFREASDYYASGAMKGSAGVFDGSTLRAIAGEKVGGRTWHVVQHEGFHQFAHAVIGTGTMPMWANEGLAEYFGEAVFTGDGFVSGVMPPFRVKRLKRAVEGDAIRPVSEMMRLSNAQWNGELNIANYDQAWAMVQFLAHGDGGKYQKAFSRFMGAIGGGQDAARAWAANFGNDAGASGFEREFKRWITELDDNPTADKYCEGTVAKLTSFLARASIAGQKFESLDAYVAAAKAGDVKGAKDDWLPPALLDEAVREVEVFQKGGFEFALGSEPVGRNTQPTVTAKLPDGTVLTGRYKVRGGKVDSVSVDRPAPAKKPTTPTTPTTPKKEPK
jgi:hypothetical protein